MAIGDSSSATILHVSQSVHSSNGQLCKCGYNFERLIKEKVELLIYRLQPNFLPRFIQLNRLGLPPNCPLENRQLAFALVDTMVGWEAHHKQRVAAGLCAATTTMNDNHQQQRGM